jgi:NADH pyrophosphatase NudC (nudix superfamily)
MVNMMRYCPLCATELTEVKIDGRQRFGCPAGSCEYVFWDNPTPVVAALVERQGRVVLARNKAWPEKMYGLITGFLEKGETPEQGVLREVEEELGLEGTIAGFIGYYPFQEMNQLILAFHVVVDGRIVLGEELSEVKMIAPEKLRPWSLGTGPAVRDWILRRNASRM